MEQKQAKPEVIHCAKCGAVLDRAMKSFIWNNNYPGACAEHLQDVLEESEKAISMWPSDWCGKSWKASADRSWRYE